MIDIANDNLDNELYLKNFKYITYDINEKIIDVKTEDELNCEKNIHMNIKNNPRQLEYWRNIFPNKTDNELKEYIDRWGKENPKYLKFKNL